MNNHSIASADRTTHLKVVALALIAGIAVAGLAIASRSHLDTGSMQTAHVIKASKLVMISNSDNSVIR